MPKNCKSFQMDASGGSGSNSPVWPIVDDNVAVDMNGTMDNLQERIENLEMVFAYLKNKKMLERQENKSKKDLRLNSKKSTMDHSFGSAEEVDHVRILQSCNGLLLCSENQVTTKWCKLEAKLNDAFPSIKGLNREFKHCKLNMEDHDHPIMTSLEIAHGLHRGKNFLESFGGPINDPILLLMELSHMLHLEGKIFESCRYLVNIVQLPNPLPKGWSIRTGVWSICLGEGEEDAFVVINLSEKVVKYNLISKTNTEIFDIGSNQMDDDDDDDAVLFIPPFEVDPNLYEIIPSLASV
ncbi:hypothetical protein Tco_1549264 [Tanacetum coccineum]